MGHSNASGGVTAPDLDTSVPAVVLKLDPNVFHHGGLGIIRSLGRLGVPVYGVHEEALAPAANSRYLRGRWFWRPDPEDPERLVQGLFRLAEHIGRPAVIVPTDDVGAIFLAEHGERLRSVFLFPKPPRELARRVAGKFSLYELCRDQGVPCAAAALPHSLDEALDFAAFVGFPLVAKPVDPWSRGVGRPLRGTVLVRSRRELVQWFTDSQRAAADICAGPDQNWGSGPDAVLMLQEYLPTEAGEVDWFMHGYCDETSKARVAFTGVKQRSYPAHFGLTSMGRAVPNQFLTELALDLLSGLSFRGIMDLDFRRDSRDGQYKLLDFNPRIGAQFRLFEDSAGLDVVRAAHLDLTGRPVPAPAPVGDRGFVVENYDAVAALRYWREGALTVPEWVRSLRGVDETAWFARDDLAPFGLMCVRTCVRAVTRSSPRATRRVQPNRCPRFRPGRASPGRGADGAYRAWRIGQPGARRI